MSEENQPQQAEVKPDKEKGIMQFIVENKEFFGVFFKGGTYLALLLILYLLGQMATLQLIGWAEEHCPNPNVEWAGNPFELTYRNMPNISEPMGMDNGGKG